ncbi:hypothetical protein [Caldisericum exile]|uniref:Nucleotidyl transferase AbiEii/AbiGii toxin family protein n=1 Tax=Caldisericum exile (strain DSM 21853 / NBRC 104410 / AZM16c01) TaxID=511051 RepID=A0A7U6GE41_CALEA|nr:hypothetical protein [Caldisericum exile]BAL80713.1 hypothetical protein CSE_05870 [Caldisericum exile AZM16c01]
MSEKFVNMSESDFVNLAKEIVKKAKENNVILRILGALAVYIHTEDSEIRNLFYTLERLGSGKPLFTDLDTVAYSRQQPLVKRFFENTLKFKPNIYVNTLFAYKRNIFEHPEGLFAVDVFYDRLEFSHNVEFGNTPGRGRLELDFPTISLADIVLEKLQIHKINRKDIVDLLILFLQHNIEVAQSTQTIDASYIAKVLSDDWGFYYDAIVNLEKVKEFTKTFQSDGKISENQLKDIIEKIDLLKEVIEKTPKTRNFQNRAKKGTSVPWYRDVEEVER